jgi:hypothetical protein
VTVLTRAAALAVIVAVAGTQQSLAQGPGGYGVFWQRPFHVGLDAGASFPTSTFGDQLQPGWDIGGNLAYPLSSHGGIWLEGDVNYASHEVNGTTVANYGASAGNAGLTSGTLNLVLNKRDYFGRVTPYILLGGGVYGRTVDLKNYGTSTYCSPFFGFCGPYGAAVPERSRTQMAPGFDGGAGLRYRFPPVRLFLEARYNSVAARHGNTTFVPLVFGTEW